MNFYVDLRLAVSTGKLAHPGDHFYFRRSAPNSWADGTRVLTYRKNKNPFRRDRMGYVCAGVVVSLIVGMAVRTDRKTACV
jgi:hypothetical protein